LVAITGKTLKKNERFGVFNRPAVVEILGRRVPRVDYPTGKAADGAARQRSSTAYPLTMVGTVTIETRGA
jgi:hypothetical protein